MQVTFSRCFHGMPIQISSSSRPSTTLHIGWVPSRKGSLMLRIWNENAKPWKASLRNSDAWRSVDRIFFRWIQMWNTLGNFVQKYVLIFDYLFVVWALISPCVALLILFVVCKRISVERCGWHIRSVEKRMAPYRDPWSIIANASKEDDDDDEDEDDDYEDDAPPVFTAMTC